MERISSKCESSKQSSLLPTIAISLAIVLGQACNDVPESTWVVSDDFTLVKQELPDTMRFGDTPSERAQHIQELYDSIALLKRYQQEIMLELKIEEEYDKMDSVQTASREQVYAVEEAIWRIRYTASKKSLHVK